MSSEAAPPHRLAAQYDALWAAAAPEVRRGRVTPDSWALRKGDDARRGVNLLARPAPSVADGLTALLAELREIEPMAWDFVMHFARDNDLVVIEDPRPGDSA